MSCFYASPESIFPGHIIETATLSYTNANQRSVPLTSHRVFLQHPPLSVSLRRTALTRCSMRPCTSPCSVCSKTFRWRRARSRALVRSVRSSARSVSADERLVQYLGGQMAGKGRLEISIHLDELSGICNCGFLLNLLLDSLRWVCACGSTEEGHDVLEFQKKRSRCIVQLRRVLLSFPMLDL